MSDLIPAGYDVFLRELKERIRAAQTRAGLAVNRELVLLYVVILRIHNVLMPDALRVSLTFFLNCSKRRRPASNSSGVIFASSAAHCAKRASVASCVVFPAASRVFGRQGFVREAGGDAFQEAGDVNARRREAPGFFGCKING